MRALQQQSRAKRVRMYVCVCVFVCTSRRVTKVSVKFYGG